MIYEEFDSRFPKLNIFWRKATVISRSDAGTRRNLGTDQVRIPEHVKCRDFTPFMKGEWSPRDQRHGKNPSGAVAARCRPKRFECRNSGKFGRACPAPNRPGRAGYAEKHQECIELNPL